MALVNHESKQVRLHVLATEDLHELRLVMINKEESQSATLDVTVKGVRLMPLRVWLITLQESKASFVKSPFCKLTFVEAGRLFVE